MKIWKRYSLEKKFREAIEKGFIKYDPGQCPEKNLRFFKILDIPLRRERLKRDPESLLKEIEREGIIKRIVAGKSWAVAFNQYPVAKRHLLIFPLTKNQKISRRIQKIERDDLDILKVGKKIGGRIFFNSLNAGATINSIHFQGIFEELPIEKLKTKIIEKKEGITISSIPEYPATVLILESLILEGEIENDFWKILERLHHKDIPYNFLLTEKRVFLFPRKKERSQLFKEKMIGTLEMAGFWVLEKEEEEISEEKIKRALKEVSLPLKEF